MKLSPLSFYVIGFTVAFIAIAFGLIMQYFPNVHDTETYKANTVLQNTEADKMPRAKTRVLNAYKTVVEKDHAWAAYVATKTPPTSVKANGIDLDVNAYQLGIDTYKFRDSIQRALNAQLRVGGVKVMNAPTIEMLDQNIDVNQILPTFYNVQALPFPAVLFDFGAITVQGTYSQIMTNVRAWKNMKNYLAVSDGLSLTGTAPLLTGTYNLSIVGFIRGKHLFTPVLSAAASTAGLGGGGRRGGGGTAPPGFPGGGGAPMGGPRGAMMPGPGAAGVPGGGAPGGGKAGGD